MASIKDVENEFGETPRSKRVGVKGSIFLVICWLITALAGIAATLIFFAGMERAESSPQEATVAAIAVAVAIVPYVITRSFEGIAKHQVR